MIAATWRASLLPAKSAPRVEIHHILLLRGRSALSVPDATPVGYMRRRRPHCICLRVPRRQNEDVWYAEGDAQIVGVPSGGRAAVRSSGRPVPRTFGPRLGDRHRLRRPTPGRLKSEGLSEPAEIAGAGTETLPRARDEHDDSRASKPGFHDCSSVMKHQKRALEGRQGPSIARRSLSAGRDGAGIREESRFPAGT